MHVVPASVASLFSVHASPAALAVGFSVLLVLSLVAAEEIEMRRERSSRTAGG